jgi:two-component system, OmpR family, response regulator
VYAQGKPRVLVVDDDRDTLQMLATFLEFAGFEVTTAGSGVEALSAAADGFDAITTDLAMPRMGGGEFIERLHDLPIRPVPVVVVTGQSVDRSVVGLQSCRILTKPCALDELVDTLQLLMTKCSHNRFCCSSCPCPLRASQPQDSKAPD